MKFLRGWALGLAVPVSVAVLALIGAVWDGPFIVKIAISILAGSLAVLPLLAHREGNPVPTPSAEEGLRTERLTSGESPLPSAAGEQNLGVLTSSEEDSPAAPPPAESTRLREALEEFGRELEQLATTLPQTPLESVRDSAQFIFDNVIRAFEISDNLANTAKEAFELSDNVQKGVKVVTDSLNESLAFAEQLFAQSRKIAKIVTIMSDISEKIHVLSINASIVSARAGMSGKGFEVVAKEIRNLAKETENSLTEIENVIAEVQTTIQNVVEKVELAHRETEAEKSALLAVAGSLQGVILAVEIIRAVSSVARERGEVQMEDFLKLDATTRETGASNQARLRAMRERIQGLTRTLASQEDGHA